MNNHFNCIYMYTNKINGKRYVGQAIDFNRRHKEHINAMINENDNEYDAPIQRAFRKYGLDNFEITILKENLNTQCLLNIYECYYIKKFDLLCKNGKGYNLSDGGSNGNTLAGKTEEEMRQWKQKQSEAHKGKKHSEESKQKMSEAHKGKNNPNYGMKGKNHSESTKQKMSKAKKGKNNPMYGVHGKDAPMYGKKHSEESKQKMSEAKKGEKHHMYGKHLPEEHKQKLSKALEGKNNPRAKRVAQYDLNGNLIRIWDYAKQASKELDIDSSGIIKCCKGKYKTVGGYIWKYVEDIE